MRKNALPIRPESDKPLRQSGDMKSWELIFDPTKDEQLRYPIGGRWDFYNLKESLEQLNPGMIFQNVFTLTLKRVEVIKTKDLKGKPRFENGFRSYIAKKLQQTLVMEGSDFRIPNREQKKSRGRVRQERLYEEARDDYG